MCPLVTSYRKILQYVGGIFQGDRCDDLGVNQDLADTDARVSKGEPISRKQTSPPSYSLCLKVDLRFCEKPIVS